MDTVVRLQPSRTGRALAWRYEQMVFDPYGQNHGYEEQRQRHLEMGVIVGGDAGGTPSHGPGSAVDRVKACQ